MVYGLGVLPVTVLMWFTSKTVRGNEKSYSFPPLQHSHMIHTGLYTASRRGEDYKNLSWYIDIRGGETLTTDCSSSSSSVRFSMLDLNVRVEAAEERLVAVHYTSNWKWLAATLPWVEYGARAGVLYLIGDTLSNMLAVKIIIRKSILKGPCVSLKCPHNRFFTESMTISIDHSACSVRSQPFNK